MHLFYIPQCSIQNRNVPISVLNGALFDMEQVHSGICEMCLLDKTGVWPQQSKAKREPCPYVWYYIPMNTFKESIVPCHCRSWSTGRPFQKCYLKTNGISLTQVYWLPLIIYVAIVPVLIQYCCQWQARCPVLTSTQMTRSRWRPPTPAGIGRCRHWRSTRTPSCPSPSSAGCPETSPWCSDLRGTWWRHQMETFSALLAICAGKFSGRRWIPRTKASDAELWCFLWSAPE